MYHSSLEEPLIGKETLTNYVLIKRGKDLFSQIGSPHEEAKFSLSFHLMTEGEQN